MFSAHGTEEGDNSFADEELRRQFRENLLEGLKAGDYPEENGDENECKSAGPSIPITERLPVFSPRKNQALRNTFGFIRPEDIPTSDDSAPVKLRVSVPEPSPAVNATARAKLTAENGSRTFAPQHNGDEPAAPASPLVPHSSPSTARPSSPLASGGSFTRTPPPAPSRTMRALPSPLGRPSPQPSSPSTIRVSPSSVHTSAAPPPTPLVSTSTTSPSYPVATSSSPSVPVSTSAPSSTDSSVPTTPPVPGGLPPPVGADGRPPTLSQRPPPPLTLPSGLPPPLPPTDPTASASTVSPPPAGGLAFARPPPPNGVSGRLTVRAAPPPVAPRTPTGSSSAVPVYATMRAQPPTPPRGNVSGSSSPVSASPPVAPSVLSSALGPGTGQSSGAGPRESDEIIETLSKKEIISVHCSIDKKDKYTVGGDVNIKLRIINDSSKIIRHVNAFLAKSTATVRQKDDKRREKNKSLPKFEGTDEMISFTNSHFPLEKGLFDETLTYRIPPCKDGSYSMFKVELVVELVLKKSSIYAFLPLNL